ncbi:PAS domain S-box protein [Pseudomonas sp. NCCP-436]|uniref:PAS domain S-box protein n=1 Tax=Pseudomonas sp. NCCP-436 TaxID=2842481 RepID=UPI001C80BB3E|nr:PAS domain S-box protein [Pseudomonas sp. NCCP-436]GIZ12409.1 PAS domain-containing sensor histidine kinase [Pseudomonas sp. NCCP-436]
MKADDLSLSAAALQSWLRVQREAPPLAARATALRGALLGCPQVRQVWYLAWQPSSCTYAQEDDGPSLPPGQGDPLQASDQALIEALEARPCLSFEVLRQLPCWLAGRLRRAALHHGQALALELQPGQPGLLLLQVDEAAGLEWLPWLRELLEQMIRLASGLARTAPLLSDDPLPAVLLDAEARPLDSNVALQSLLGQRSLAQLGELLPVNHLPLIRACLQQNRAIESVETQDGERVLVWSFIPDQADRRVLARCREATREIRESREAARAQRLYRLITENTTDLISRHTPDGVFLDASPASWTLLGYWPEELRGVSVTSLLHPQESGLQIRQAAEALEQDGYHTMSFRIRHREGHYLWFETASRAIRETYTGAVVEVVSVSRDITARIQAEENKRRLAEVVEANTDLVLFVEPGGRLTHLNPSARRALGIASEQVLPELGCLLLSEDLARLEREGWTRADECGVWSSEARLLPLSGGSLPVSLVLLAHRGAGEERYYSLVARDMTERELREAQQRRHQDELAHTARLVTLGELASGIAHEINQPLAAVVNYASASQRYLQQAASDTAALDKVSQGLARITEHANHASEVIKRLRAFLRKGQRRMQALNLAEVAREAVRLCQWEAGATQVAVLDLLPDDLPPVYADRVLLEQVLLNLLRNAIDANREVHAGSASQIRLEVREHVGSLAIRVIDQGPGVSEEHLGKLFTPFYTSKAEGLGLGLSMSRSIIEGFGGALEASPAAGGGLCLECRLPLGRGEEAEGEAGQT